MAKRPLYRPGETTLVQSRNSKDLHGSKTRLARSTDRKMAWHGPKTPGHHSLKGTLLHLLCQRHFPTTRRGKSLRQPHPAAISSGSGQTDVPAGRIQAVQGGAAQTT